jgi:hypothetical protein
MSADQSFLQEQEEIRKLHRNAFGDPAMNRVEFRVCVCRRASAVSFLFSD